MFSCFAFSLRPRGKKKSRQKKRRARYAEKISTRGIQTYEFSLSMQDVSKNKTAKAILNCKSYGYKQSKKSGEGSIKKFPAQPAGDRGWLCYSRPDPGQVPCNARRDCR